MVREVSHKRNITDLLFFFFFSRVPCLVPEENASAYILTT